MFEATNLSPEILIPLFFSLVGGGVALAGQVLLAKFSQNLSLSAKAWERIQGRRLDAFDQILSIAADLKTTEPTGHHEDGHVETVPSILKSKEQFFDWFSDYLKNQKIWEPWVNEICGKHMRYLTDYLVNVANVIDRISDEEMDELAATVKSDFIDLAQSTTAVAHDFFAQINSKPRPLRGNGKYPLAKTDRLLSKTELTKYMTDKDLLLKADDKFHMTSKD